MSICDRGINTQVNITITARTRFPLEIKLLDTAQEGGLPNDRTAFHSQKGKGNRHTIEHQAGNGPGQGTINTVNFGSEQHRAATHALR